MLKHTPPDKDVAKTPKATFYIYPTQNENRSFPTTKETYYSSTAYTGRPSSTDYFAKSNDQNNYVKNQYKRLYNVPEITGDDYIAGQPPRMFRLRPIQTTDKFFISIPKTAVDREQQAYQIEYLDSQHNLASKFYFLATLGYVLSTFGFGIAFLGVILLGYVVGLYDTWNGFLQYILITFEMAAIGFIFWKLSTWIAKKLPDNKFLKLNRRTGMVCFPQRGKKPDIEIPFSEFEPRYSIRSGTTNFYHRLIYVHKSGNRIFSGGERTLGDVYAKAAYFEQFMDITKPLPDMPNLEWCRSKDPTTAAYDKQTHRDPNFWRNKPPLELEEIAKERQKKINTLLGQDSFQV